MPVGGALAAALVDVAVLVVLGVDALWLLPHPASTPAAITPTQMSRRRPINETYRAATRKWKLTP
jgi:hypothetical protein